MTPIFSSPSSNNHIYPQGHDENNFPFLNTNHHHHWNNDNTNTNTSTPSSRETARKKVSASSQHLREGTGTGNSNSTTQMSLANTQTTQSLTTSTSAADGWSARHQVESSTTSVLPPRGKQHLVDSFSPRHVSSSTNANTTMREPVAIPSPVEHHRKALTPRTIDSSAPRTDFFVESSSAMTGHGHGGRSRNPTTDGLQDSNNSHEGHGRPSPRNSKASATRRPHDSPSVQSQTSGPTSDWQWEQNNDPDDQEQALFEQRLCEDIYGVAVRKINQNGKSNLRFVKCCNVESSELDVDANGFSSSRSVSSRSRGFSRFTRDRGSDRSLERAESREFEAHRTLMKGQKVKVLTWGKKKDVKIPLERFVCVRKGKTTDRTRRNICPATRILSLITDDPYHVSLDIEAPTRLDRDKFAKAFSRFLGIPLEENDMRSVRSDMTPQSIKDRKKLSQQAPSLRQHLVAANSAPDIPSGVQTTNSHATNNSRKHIPLPPIVTTGHANAKNKKGLPPPRGVSTSKARRTQEAAATASSNTLDIPDPQISSLPSSSRDDSNFEEGIPVPPKTNSLKASDKASDRSQPATPRVQLHSDDDGSVVSSITGAGYDQEIVEELHMALTELRAELEESRAEAARAVKVAEQAIQSAENSSSKDWNSTVTHKAAEAAALAQKKSAEAMAKARLAEERLEGERKNGSIWRKQAEAAEEEAGHWQTRAAAAEVQRAAISEGLGSERKKAAMLLASMKQRFTSSETYQRDAFEATMERNRTLELELEVLRESLSHKNDEVVTLQDCLSEVETSPEAYKSLARKKPGLLGRGKTSDDRDGAANALLSPNSLANHAYESRQSAPGSVPPSELSKVHSEFQIVRKQFELLKKATADELKLLPASAKLWAEQASQAVLTSQSEIDRLRSKLAMESASRRKLLHEVQDLRGTVRVYCRLRPTAKGVSTISTPSQDVLLLNRPGFKDGVASSFQFDGILGSEMDQQDLYDELDEVCLSALDGYNVCILTYGQSGSGKTYTLLGEVAYGTEAKETVVSINNYGIQLLAARQFFSVLKHRSERYDDVVTFNVVEVHDERLCDLLAGTDIGETNGRMEGSRKSNRKRVDSHDSSASPSSRPTKLEIRNNHNGETVVHGLLSVEVTSFEDVVCAWKECLSKRKARLSEQGVDFTEHESNSHVIGTLQVFSTNISTGVGTTGKIQFVDLASSDVIPNAPKRSGSKKVSTPEAMLPGFGNNQEWKCANRSLTTLSEVVNARSQFQRSVPYRNSTITHLLSDSLESDTKVVMVACVSSDPQDLQETACTLKFAQKMRKVAIGKATKHTLSHA